jgi:hypothetical protein
MKKRLGIIALITAVLALAITPVLVFAQGETTTSAVRPVKDGLAIVAPRAAAVGQKISMTVFQCSDQTPVSGAGVWLLTLEKLEVLKGALNNLKNNGDVADQDKKSEALFGVHGTLLGRTDASGKLWHTFNDAGRYVLVTFKAGYWPDFRPIAVGDVSQGRPRLAIDAPNRAEVGEKIIITVTDKETQEKVKEAGVWALSGDKAESVKAQFTSQKAGSDQDALAAQIENSLNVNGVFLGKTNGDGKVQHAFDNAGGYLLVTFKRGYVPAFKPILIGTAPKALSIDAPDKAKIAEKITVTVTEKNTSEAVKDAGVWALTRENAASLKDEFSAAMTTGDAAAIQVKIEGILNSKAIFLGTTNGAGKLLHAFQKAGGYLLVTYKPGYVPGIKTIVIVDNKTEVSTGNTNKTTLK